MTPYCSQEAQATATPLYGTAARKKVWLLLEYNQVWEAKAIQNNLLPPLVQQWLEKQTSAVDGRALFIKKAPKLRDSFITFYIAVTDADAPKLFQYHVRTYDQLLDIDVAAVISGEQTATEKTTPLLLVCTNGKRDRCCAKFGLPVYNAFTDEDGFETWQTTHIGGHRYAATAVTFPTGIYYGYLAPTTVPTVAQAIRDDEIFLPAYRGRTIYHEAVSAADYFVRQQVGDSRVGGPQVTKFSEQDGVWKVDFSIAEHNHRVQLTQSTTEPIFASCDKPFKPSKAFQFQTHTIGETA